MRETIKRVASLVLGVVVLSLPAGPGFAWAQGGSTGEQVTTDLGGYWSLNRALSDDPNDQLRNVRGGTPPPGRPPPDVQASPDAGSLEAVRRAAQGFSLTVSDSTVVIGYPGRDVALRTDGKKQKIQVAEGQEAEYRAWWADGRLFVERKLDRGLTAVEQYWVQAGTERLHVLTRLEGERLPQTISFVRVYDATAPPEGG